MRIKMLKTTKGSENGYIIREFLEGKEYETTERMAEVFVCQMKVAEYVKPTPFEEMISSIENAEKKMVEESPQNKAVDTSPNNKGRRRRYSRKISK